jgi:hypothetical protein
MRGICTAASKYNLWRRGEYTAVSKYVQLVDERNIYSCLKVQPVEEG